MDQSSVVPSQDLVKAPPTLDKIPEDIQLAIIKFIQSWKRSEGTEQEREKGKRARDSALRAVALSCRNLLSIYQPELLSNVTLNSKSLLNFYLALVRDQESGKLVRSITLTDRDVKLTQQDEDEAQKHLLEIWKALTAQRIKIDPTNIVNCVVEAIFQYLPHIQTLIIQAADLVIPLQSRLVDGKIAPLPLLTHSLKQLVIHMWRVGEKNLKARNVVWILVFCTGLRSAALGCIFDEKDFQYLAELSDTFTGLSGVQKLALGTNFSSSEKLKRKWDGKVGRQWIGGNMKSQAVFYLLKVTKNLRCLEINNLPSVLDERTFIKSSCLSALRSSFESLEHLRLLGIGTGPDNSEEHKASIDLSLFLNLKMVSIDQSMVMLLARSSYTKLPSGLKILFVPYYFSQSVFEEDRELARSFKVRSYPSLETMIVPSNPIVRTGDVSDSDAFKKRCLEGRRELEKAGVFTSGKVKLRLVEPGEFIGEPPEIDFMSTLPWLSPP